MNKKQKSTYIIIGVLAVALVGAAAYFGMGEQFQGRFGFKRTPTQTVRTVSEKADTKTKYDETIFGKDKEVTPPEKEVTPEYLGACVIRDQNTSLPLYNDPDSGTGYAKIKIAGNFRDVEAIRAACTDNEFTQIWDTFCEANPGSKGQEEIALYNQDGSRYSTGCDDMSDCNFKNCILDEGTVPALTLAATTPPSGEMQLLASEPVLDFNFAVSGPNNMEGKITDIGFSTGTCTPGQVKLYEGQTLVASSDNDAKIDMADFVNGEGITVNAGTQKTYRVMVDTTSCGIDEVVYFRIDNFMYDDGSGSGYQYADFATNNYRGYTVTPAPFVGNALNNS